MELSKLAPPRGSRRRRKLLGRGEASGHGKTCCRGGKGQTARTGGTIRSGFEGGQMPLYRRLPKTGFTSLDSVSGRNQFTEITLETLNRFDNGSTINVETLKAKGIRVPVKNRAGIKVLASGELTKKLTVQAHAVTAGAKQKIEAAGGTVTLIGSRAEAKA